MPSSRFHDNNVARPSFVNLFADDESRDPVLHKNDFVVFMQMQRRSPPRLGFDQKEGDVQIPLLGAYEIVGAPD